MMVITAVSLFARYVGACHNDKVKAIMQRHAKAFKLIDVVSEGYAEETPRALEILDPLVKEMRETLS